MYCDLPQSDPSREMETASSGPFHTSSQDVKSSMNLFAGPS